MLGARWKRVNSHHGEAGWARGWRRACVNALAEPSCYGRAAMNPNKLFIEQKTQQAIVVLEAARSRAGREPTLLDLAQVIGRVQVNPLVKPLPTVRAAVYRLRAETERRAAKMAAELVENFRTEPRSSASVQRLRETCEACAKVFPREAQLLRRVLEESTAPSAEAARG
jgi:hypothetical protein